MLCLWMVERDNYLKRPGIRRVQVQGITLVGVAKGPTRKAGLENLFLGSSVPLRLADSMALHFSASA